MSRKRTAPENKIDPIKDRHSIFVAEYLKHFNSTRAAKAAGYSEKTAGSQGHDLLKDPEIQAAISAGMKDRMERTKIDQDFTLKRLAILAQSNVKFVTKWTKSGLELKPSAQLTDDEAYTIESISITPTKYGKRVSVKMRNPSQALELLGQHQGIFEGKTDKPNDALKKAIEEFAAERAAKKKK